ncbi:MAG: metallophosphoesterase [Alphaproteobacteria bacterium]|nr:metallophosphoesterase [Alphaproteobacteria bacterium]
MPRISAICLSDLHFGYWGSVLTAADGRKADITRVSPVLEQLVECIKSILDSHEGEEKPRLVLAGDVLELALVPTNVAATVFAQFLEKLFGDETLPLDRRIVYLPGNHDHHLWELAREQQYTGYLAEKTTKLPFENSPWHATHLFPWRPELGVNDRDVGNLLLDTIAKKVPGLTGKKKVSFLSMYPNFGVLGAGGSRCTVVHHGHFTESIYYLMTELQRILIDPEGDPPANIWDVEVENFAWIEFLWGTLGRSGRVGESVGLVYELLQTRAGRNSLVRTLAWNIPSHFQHPRWLRPFEILILYLVLRRLVDRFTAMEREIPGEYLSADSWERLEKYLGDYVEGQLGRERNQERGEKLPEHVNFVFGHTHKPFEKVHPVGGVARPVHIYNTGGWVVDSDAPAARQGGAIVVIDDDGNAASVRMYNEAADPGDYAVDVKQAGGEGGGDNPLYDSLRALVKPDQPPWSAFSGEVAKAVAERCKTFREITGG